MSRDETHASEQLPAFQPNWAFFLDVDGTLVDFAPTPGDVRVQDSLRDLVRKLQAHSCGALALVSGRAVADLERLFDPLRVPLSGQHGVERLDAAGRLRRHAIPDDGLRAAASELQSLAARHEGLVFEDKGFNLAVHYRLAPERGPEVERVVRRLAQALAPHFEVQGGKLLWEIKPAGRDKGSALQEFLEEPPFAGRVPVAIGDDITDEAALRAANALGGVSIKVGPGPSAGRYRLPDPKAVHNWLAGWCDWMERR